MSTRQINQIIASVETSDGAGVRLRRSLGQHHQFRLDPFLMLDEFGSDKPNEYIAGFPPHPHRGFETVTYMLDGHMLHQDHMGNRGDLRSGDVQWMTAARGIIHSEMPQQEHGLMRGFQLWLNLPAKEKMKPASYRDIPSSQIPTVQNEQGVWVKVIAGTSTLDGKQVTGPINGLTTEPIYIDVHLPAGQSFAQTTPVAHNAFIYLYEGELQLGDESVPSHAAALLGPGEEVKVTASRDAKFLLLAAMPLNEPIVQYGPFVMNTREEIERAVSDYQSGRLTA
ncbi:MAG TPA: pirin family protein [Steroidobacteraceae bacterium]|nr:pirin family protein [Steroidobacteraceae bacterium]